MKVQCLNSSSLKTRDKIKKAFVTLINEKKALNKITVTELVRRAEITRSTFYTHYDTIYQVAQEYQMQTIELLCSEDLFLNSKEDVLEYFDNIFMCLKENETTYHLLLSADESLLFLNKLKVIASKKIEQALKPFYQNQYLNLTISFLMNGLLIEIINYFRNESNYSLDEIHWNIKNVFQKIFV